MYFSEQSVDLVSNVKYLERRSVASICTLASGPANVRAAPGEAVVAQVKGAAVAFRGKEKLSIHLWPAAFPSGEFPRLPQPAGLQRKTAPLLSYLGFNL